MAMAVSFGIKSWIEGGVIAAVIFLNITGMCSPDTSNTMDGN